ncbi:hypothetical protein FNF29_07004 [Cafeteria roenbergensis]|uniref:Peptidase S9 prolyl oligopeptidase catalytic domain-containing protein n=1 Tax=Cafeteria roenbergensis TaxID=33653 RepID=A0A5A8C520_CAFRO|nr:hypothetical protein FNF29_07004 [Cafeteria roenbergensis]|eukprot:KAA0147915.1 hypothetical protein FNF29_07004 [Cafeteria roenbergensis]
MLREAPRQPATAADRVLGTGDEAPPATVGQVLGVSGADMQALRMLARSRCRVELGGGRAGRAHRGGGSTGADACGVLDGWLWLGPWSAGKLEVEADPVGDSGGDGLFGGSAPGAGILGPGFARGDALYASPSEVVEGGAKWSVAASAPSAQRPADSLAFADGAGGLEAAPVARALAAEAGAEGAAWNALVQGVGTAAVLEVQGWAVSSLSLPEAATLVVACSGPTAVWLVRPAAEAGGGGWDRALPLAADVYGGGWASWSGRLPAGPYELVSRLRGRARASLACSVRAFRRQADAPALAAERSGLVSAPDAVRVDPEWGPEASSSAVLAGAWVGARLAVGARPVALVASEARVTADGAGAGGLGQWSSGRVADAFKAGRRPGSTRAAAALSERLGGVPAPSVADAGGFEFGVPAWVVVAPERRGAHNWEGPHGQGTVSAAVAAVPLLLGRLAEAARRLVGAGAAAQSTSGLAGASAGAGALDWEGVCRDRGALAAVGRWWPCQPTPDGQRVLWAGHSMGGHGAWVALSRGAGRAVCAWPGAGWLSKEAYSDANLLLGPVDAAAAHWGRSDGGLRGVLHSCVVGNDAEANAADVAAGVPTVVRTGADDATVPPLFSRRGARAVGAAQARRAASLAALVRAGAAAVAPPAVSSAWLRLEQIPGKGHWFWDTRSPNDGGVLADCASRAFMAACASRPSDAAGVRAWQAAADGALSAQGNPATARPASSATCAPPQAGERRVLDEAWVAGVFSVSVGDDQEAEGRRGLAIARRGTAGGVAVATVGVSVSACGGAGDSAERGPVVWTLLSHGNVAALRLDTTVLCAAGRPAALVQRARLLPNSSSAWQRVTPGPSQAGLLSAAVSRLAGELGLAGVPAAELAEPWAEFAPPSVVRDASGRELWSAEQSGVCSRDPDRPLRAVRVSVQFPPAARDRGRAGGPFAGAGLDAESAEVQPKGGVRPAAAAPRRPWPASFARDVWRRPVTIVVGSRCLLRNGTEQACHEDEMTQRNALAAFIASHGALAADAHVSIVADAVPGLAESQVRRGDAVIAVGGAGSNLWLRRAAGPHAGANASAVIPAGLCGLARRCSESLAATGGSGSQGAVLSVGFVDAGATRSPLLVLDSVGAVDAARGSLAWSLHAVLAAPTVPPMTRAPWTNAVPGLLLAGPRLLAEGDAAFLAAGVWEQTGDSSSLDAAASAVMRC